MATVTIPAPEAPSPQRLLLYGVDWPAYCQISDALTGRHVRLTYDRGNLEFMTISPEHGNYSRVLARLVTVLTEEFELPLRSFGDMTCRREDLARGLEPDESFYITNEPLLRGRQEIDLSVDPPPDLMLEIDIPRSSRGRLGICEAMRVPEVWRFDGEVLHIYRLAADGKYVRAAESQYFPDIPAEEIAASLRRCAEMDGNSLVREFRAWVRGRRGQQGEA